MNVVIIINPT